MNTIELFALIACCLIGVAMGIVICAAVIRELRDTGEDEPEKDRRTCETCRYGKVRPQDDPCCDCLQDDDIDRWESL